MYARQWRGLGDGEGVERRIVFSAFVFKEDRNQGKPI